MSQNRLKAKEANVNFCLHDTYNFLWQVEEDARGEQIKGAQAGYKWKEQQLFVPHPVKPQDTLKWHLKSFQSEVFKRLTLFVCEMGEVKVKRITPSR